MTPPRPLLVALLAALAGTAGAQPGDPGERRAHVEGLFVRALTAHALGDAAAAIEALDEVLELSPDDPAAYDARADVAEAQGQTADAVFYAERAVELAPDVSAFHLRLARVRAEAGRIDDALEAAEAAQALAPGDPAVWEATAELAARAGRDDVERDALTAWVRLHDTAAARLRLSAVHEVSGDADAALDHALAARRLAPADPAALRRVAALQAPTATPPPSPSSGGAAAGSAGEDVDALLRTVEADPRRLDAWAQVLQALAEAGDPRAGTVADDALLLFSSVPAVATSAAEAYLAAGRPADARRAADRALAALDTLADDLSDADALRARLQRILSATDG